MYLHILYFTTQSDVHSGRKHRTEILRIIFLDSRSSVARLTRMPKSCLSKRETRSWIDTDRCRRRLENWLAHVRGATLRADPVRHRKIVLKLRKTFQENIVQSRGKPMSHSTKRGFRTPVLSPRASLQNRTTVGRSFKHRFAIWLQCPVQLDRGVGNCFFLTT